jgi:hypothetical protein
MLEYVDAVMTLGNVARDVISEMNWTFASEQRSLVFRHRFSANWIQYPSWNQSLETPVTEVDQQAQTIDLRMDTGACIIHFLLRKDPKIPVRQSRQGLKPFLHILSCALVAYQGNSCIVLTLVNARDSIAFL